MIYFRFESYNSLIKHKKRLHSTNKLKFRCNDCSKVNKSHDQKQLNRLNETKSHLGVGSEKGWCEMCRFQKCLCLILRMLPRRITGFAEKSSSPFSFLYTISYKKLLLLCTYKLSILSETTGVPSNNISNFLSIIACYTPSGWEKM